MATGLDCPLHIYDGDIIQLYCPNESGYVYSEPRSPQKESDAIVICSKEDFLLNDFTEFCITLKKVSDEKLHSECGVQVVERIAYGSIVYLEHQASMKFMTVHDENNVSLLKLNTQGKVKNSGIQGDKKKKMFRILSPCQKLAWGKELKNNDAFMLESISCDSLMVHFSYNPQDNGYKPSLKPMGTVFIINLHCHMRLKQNPKSIKGGSLVYLASLLEMEAYIHGTGSFISSNYSVTKGGHAIEEPHEFKNPNLGPDWQLLECISETSKVGLIKFNEGNFKMLPQLGDTFFKIEKVSEERAGDPILFGEQCRIRHLFTLKYICVHEKNNVINIVLCDKECDHGRSIFKILPVSNPAHKKEVSCSDKVIFENIKTSTMYLSVNLKPHSLMDQAAIDQAAMDQAAMDHPLTLCRDRDVSRNQFEILQIEDYLVLRSYKYMVIGSLFKKSQNVIKDITKLKSEEEISMMRKLMGDEIFEAIRKHDEQPLSYDKQNEKNDEIDLHIKKIIYEKIWKHTEELKLIATILLKDNIEMLTEKGEMRTKIEKQMTCLENYFKQCETGVSTAKQSRDQVAIDIEVINDPQAQELLQLFHLFYKKHELSANYDEKDKSAETRDLSAENQQKLCKILSQLISIEKSDISYMSAWLLFEIYTKGKSHSTEDSRKEERSHSSDSTEDSWIKLQLSTMIAKGNSLLKQILTSSMDADSIEELNKLAKSCIDLHEVEVPEPNHARQTEAVGQTEVPNFKRQIEAPNFERQTKAFESGLFHIILEYSLRHKAETEVLESCFKLLQGICTLNKKVHCELFIYLYDFLQFEQVTNAMICLLNEIFYDNSALCNKLTEGELKKIFHTAIISSTSSHYWWIIVLQTIVEYSNQIIMQDYVAQLILEHSNDYLKHILCPREEGGRVNHWLKILEYNEEDRNDCHLLLGVTDLLASCLKGCYSVRTVAIKLFKFSDLIKILVDDNIVGYNRKLPFIRILTWTYLVDGSSLSSTKEYKNLWSHIVDTINSFDVGEEKIIAHKSHWAFHQQTVDGGKYEKSANESLLKLMYISDGVIPFLSLFCEKMSLQPSNKVCSVNELTSIGEKLSTWHFVSVQLSRFECIENINLLLKKNESTPLKVPPKTSDPSSIPHDNCDVVPIEPNYKEMIELMKSKDLMSVLSKVILLLKNLVILHKEKHLSCLKRIHLEKMVLKTLKFLETLIQQIKEDTVAFCDDDAQQKELKKAKIILQIDEDCKTNKTDTLFDLLQHQNINIIVAVLQVLKCLSSLTKNEDIARKIQIMIIKSCKEHNCILIVKVHQLLKEVQFVISKMKESEWESVLKAIEHNITAALDAISLLCDRQQKEMQDAMQNASNNGLDIVNRISFMLFLHF